MRHIFPWQFPQDRACPNTYQTRLPFGYRLWYSESMNEIIFEVREDESEGGFVARALGHSIVTQAETWEDLRANVRDAVRCHFEEGQAPRVIRLHRVFDEVLALG